MTTDYANAKTDLTLCSGGLYDEPITKDACLQCALNKENRCGYDYGLLRRIYADDAKERTGIHVTDLTGCLRRTWYAKTQPMPEFPHEKHYRVVGTIVHGLLEGEDEHLDTEVPLNALGITGRCDAFYKNGTIVDYKTTRWLDPEKLPYGEHATQVNIYAALLREMGYGVNALAIQYIDLSGPTRCRRCKVPVVPNAGGEPVCPKCFNQPNGAHFGAVLYDIDIMPHEEVAELINTRRDLLQFAVEMNEEPEREESWLCNYCAYREVCGPASLT